MEKLEEPFLEVYLIGLFDDEGNFKKYLKSTQGFAYPTLFAAENALRYYRTRSVHKDAWLEIIQPSEVEVVKDYNK